MLRYRLPGISRATQDINGLVRVELDEFLTELDRVPGEPSGPLTLVRGEVETVQVPHRLVKPRRFDVTVSLKGVTWRWNQMEIASDEGHAGATPAQLAAPSLAKFGLPTPDSLASLSMRCQIAQKIHACTDPRDPPLAARMADRSGGVRAPGTQPRPPPTSPLRPRRRPGPCSPPQP
jgi:hypothetical protein